MESWFSINLQVLLPGGSRRKGLDGKGEGECVRQGVDGERMTQKKDQESGVF